MRIVRVVLFIISFTLINGCIISDSSHILTGIKREPISVDQVRLYSEPPAKYDVIAIVSANAAHDFVKQQKLVDEIVRKLKTEAAKLGANGVLLESVANQNTGSNGVFINPANGGTGFIIQENSSGKTASGKAIFVLEANQP